MIIKGVFRNKIKYKMKDFFISQFKHESVQFTREYISAKDIWYLLTIGIEKKEIKLRMHNNKEGSWKIMGKRIPDSLLRMEEDFNELICKNER